MPLTLLHPALFALGAACVAIPIILHLLKRKRRPIPWGAMRFLEEAYRKRKRIITLEQLVLLALRCLLILLIALGVGSLMLGSGLARSVPTTMVIVLDDSIGSALTIDGVTDLERNKSLALEALAELDAAEGDQAVLISASGPASGIVLPESNDLGAVRSLIERRTPTDSASDLAEAIALARGLGDDPDRPSRRVVLIAASPRGPLRAESGDASAGRAAADQLLIAAPDPQSPENIGITSAAPTRSLVTSEGITLPVGVRVELMRSGDIDSPRQIRVRMLNHLDEPLGERTLQWETGQQSASAAVGIDAEALGSIGARAALVRIAIDEDANPRDNTRLLTITLRSRIRVGVIDRPAPIDAAGESTGSSAAQGITPSRWVRAALAPGDGFGIEIVSIEASRAGALITPDLDAVVLLAPGAIDDAGWDRLAQLHESGSLLIITPDAGSRSSAWAQRVRGLDESLLDSGAGVVEHEPPLELSPEIPVGSVLSGIGSEAAALGRAVSVSRTLTLGGDARASILMSDGSPLAVQSTGENGAGMVIVFAPAFDLEWTNLPARPMFVAMMQEIVRQGVGVGSSMPQLTAGDRLDVPAWSRSTRRLAIAGATSSGIGEEDTRYAGVLAHLDAQGAARQLSVVNPDAQGADTDAVSREALAAMIESLVDAPEVEWIEREDVTERSEATGGASLLGMTAPSVSIALWMLLAAGVVAVVEFVLARFFTARLLGSEMATAGGRT
ncbi:MAG: BatA domain-containing protein [Phycisphaerales bacterium]